MKLLKDFLNHFLIDVKLDLKDQREVFIAEFIICLANVLK